MKQGTGDGTQRFPDMNTAIGILLLVALIATVVAANVWYRRHRAHMTRREKQVEDREIERQEMIW